MMDLKKIILVFSLLIVYVNVGKTQTVDLRKDEAFFMKQDSNYQRWIAAVGLGEYLKKDKFKIRKRKLIYSLSFNYTKADTATYAWRQLKKDFEKNNAFTLEEQLFSKLASLMEVEYNQLILKVYNTPPFGELPAVDGRIDYDETLQKIVWDGTFRSEVPDSVFIQEFKLCEQYNQDHQLLASRKLPEEWKYHIYKKLTQKVVNYFNEKVDSVCVVSRDPIELRVMNIKSEVIPPGTFSILNPNELLSYKIALKREEDGQVRLSCVVDGKFGNGLWKPRSLDGFRDMSPEYDKELTHYTRQFTRRELVDMLDEILMSN